MFKTITLFTTLALIGTAVSAADWRLLANKPADQSIAQFQASCVPFLPLPPTMLRVLEILTGPTIGSNSFETTCPIFDTSNPDGARTTFFRAGDFQGKNTDTQALVFCTYNAADGSVYAVTRELVESLGGSIA
ncbi:hypothetical protein L202_07224 [Cryptococcus amylolentus CBS 6039]|uniref:Uncharacterized protein n=2 Tax=Cryptococcus amylolentus TaxID=104669 RepID=A0A1E3HBH1_9TREE|nr:hypothetical protein L202_07224 [Cryptococcus amylolentus CBS 6039]ODN73677.1 hypothetical protein L202_07224 [Cryptococcus amylolentus CBS 6039]ODO00429.1 hypothetical protein I350_07069 [Cryptococcus amylolentus CBS 6273]